MKAKARHADYILSPGEEEAQEAQRKAERRRARLIQVRDQEREFSKARRLAYEERVAQQRNKLYQQLLQKWDKKQQEELQRLQKAQAEALKAAELAQKEADEAAEAARKAEAEADARRTQQAKAAAERYAEASRKARAEREAFQQQQQAHMSQLKQAREIEKVRAAEQVERFQARERMRIEEERERAHRTGRNSHIDFRFTRFHETGLEPRSNAPILDIFQDGYVHADKSELRARRAAEDAKAAEQRGREALRRVRMERAAAQLIAQLEEQLQARRAAAAAAAAAASPTRAPAAYSGREESFQPCQLEYHQAREVQLPRSQGLRLQRTGGLEQAQLPLKTAPRRLDKATQFPEMRMHRATQTEHMALEDSIEGEHKRAELPQPYTPPDRQQHGLLIPMPADLASLNDADSPRKEPPPQPSQPVRSLTPQNGPEPFAGAPMSPAQPRRLSDQWVRQSEADINLQVEHMSAPGSKAAMPAMHLEANTRHSEELLCSSAPALAGNPAAAAPLAVAAILESHSARKALEELSDPAVVQAAMETSPYQAAVEEQQQATAEAAAENLPKEAAAADVSDLGFVRTLPGELSDSACSSRAGSHADIRGLETGAALTAGTPQQPEGRRALEHGSNQTVRTAADDCQQNGGAAGPGTAHLADGGRTSLEGKEASAREGADKEGLRREVSGVDENLEANSALYNAACAIVLTGLQHSQEAPSALVDKPQVKHDRGNPGCEAATNGEEAFPAEPLHDMSLEEAAERLEALCAAAAMHGVTPQLPSTLMAAPAKNAGRGLPDKKQWPLPATEIQDPSQLPAMEDQADGLPRRQKRSQQSSPAGKEPGDPLRPAVAAAEAGDPRRHQKRTQQRQPGKPSNIEREEKPRPTPLGAADGRAAALQQLSQALAGLQGTPIDVASSLQAHLPSPHASSDSALSGFAGPDASGGAKQGASDDVRSSLHTAAAMLAQVDEDSDERFNVSELGGQGASAARDARPVPKFGVDEEAQLLAELEALVMQSASSSSFSVPTLLSTQKAGEDVSLSSLELLAERLQDAISDTVSFTTGILHSPSSSHHGANAQQSPPTALNACSKTSNHDQQQLKASTEAARALQGDLKQSKGVNGKGSLTRASSSCSSLLGALCLASMAEETPLAAKGKQQSAPEMDGLSGELYNSDSSDESWAVNILQQDSALADALELEDSTLGKMRIVEAT